MTKKRLTKIISFRPPPDVEALLNRAMKKRLGVAQTKFICEAIRAHFGHLAGKRIEIQN